MPVMIKKSPDKAKLKKTKDLFSNKIDIDCKVVGGVRI